MTTQQWRAVPFVLLLLPLDLLVAVGLGIASLLGRLSRPSVSSSLPEPPQKKDATILILNWDGKHLLQECIPAALSAIRAVGGTGHRVLVVDNGSTDGSVSFVRERFPEVKVLELDRNYGFVGGNNRGVATVDTEIVVLLNNDMVVEQGFLAPLLDGFANANGPVFAVTSQIFFEESSKRREETGKTRGRFERGFFRLWHADIDEADDTRPTLPVFWGGGGSCAFDRAKYLEIGGLDTLYHPFYVEDTDLSYQAWKRGWKCLLAPASHVVHKHRATTGRKHSHGFIEGTIRRNMYLFIWKNLTDLSMLFEHVTNLPRIHGSAMMNRGGVFEVRAYIRAVSKLPEALSKRLGGLKHYRVSDAEVLKQSGQ